MVKYLVQLGTNLVYKDRGCGPNSENSEGVKPEPFFDTLEGAMETLPKHSHPNAVIYEVWPIRRVTSTVIRNVEEIRGGDG